MLFFKVCVGGGDWRQMVKKYKFPVISTSDVMYKMMNVVNSVL